MYHIEFKRNITETKVVWAVEQFEETLNGNAVIVNNPLRWSIMDKKYETISGNFIIPLCSVVMITIKK